MQQLANISESHLIDVIRALQYTVKDVIAGWNLKGDAQKNLWNIITMIETDCVFTLWNL